MSRARASKLSDDHEERLLLTGGGLGGEKEAGSVAISTRERRLLAGVMRCRNEI